jgi:chromosome segregation ATPase
MTSADERHTVHVQNTLAWLEDELRDSRAAQAKLAQALEQAQAQLWELTGRLHRVEDAVAAITPRLGDIPELETQVRQLKDVIGRVHDHGLATGTRLGEVARQVEAAAERDRQALNEVAHRLDAVERHVQGAGPRFDALDESGRRSMEALTLLRQRLEELTRAVDGLEGRLARMGEAGSRTEQELGRLGSEIDGLRRQDELIAERVQVYTEMLKRLEGRIALVAADVAVKHDVIEQIDLARVETHRLEERLSGLEATAEGLHERDETAAHQLTVLEGRQKGLQDRLAGLQHDFAAHRAQVAEQFQRLQQLQERLRRRQMEELEREIRELRLHAFRPQEEP